MTEAPKRIWASIEDDRQDPETSAYYVGGSFDAGEFKQGQEYVRADIADEMLEALKEAQAMHQRYCDRVGAADGWARRMQSRINAAIAKAEGGDK